jgi:truncated hemoglobin YjbI
MGDRNQGRKPTDPAAVTGAGSDLYRALGGMDAGHRLSAAFYSRVEHDPVLRPLYSRTLKCPIHNLGAFLEQFTGGPNEYPRRPWSLSMREAHLRFRIGPEHRDAWLRDMRQAMEDLGIHEPARSSLNRFFEQASVYLVNHPKGTADESALARELYTEAMPDPIVREIARRWDAIRTLEAAVAAVRKGEAQKAVALAESPILQSYFQDDRGALLSLLAIMSQGPGARGQGPAEDGAAPSHVLLDYVRGKLAADPGLARESYGRTLLHDVAGERSIEIVKMLLRLGADPNARDEGGHTPLYCVGNACSEENGEAVVRMLVEGGADVNVHDGVKHCTALHIAARRGNVRVAEALLDCGADIEARDILGDTPLRRAVNCAKPEVVALLLLRVADVHSRGSRGLTPWQAARGPAMKRLLQDGKARASLQESAAHNAAANPMIYHQK